MAVPSEPVSFILKAGTEKWKADAKPQGSGRKNKQVPLPKAEIMRILWSVSHCSLSRTQ